MNTHKKIILHLTLVDGVGPGIIQKIIAHKPKHITWNDLYYFSVSDWVQCGIPILTAEKITAGLQTDYHTQERDLIEKHQINWATILDPEYPELLKHIHLPPPVLYWQGTLPQDEIKTIAVVGARKADEYGRRAIERLIPSLVHHGIAVVSGGALGADSMAHRATLDAGGITIAVLGSGLLRPYPREHKSLFARIIEKGAVISSFPLSTTPHPGNFPARNRIIAGLSSRVLVVQAARKSGARITAQFALEQGRDVFAVPGSIDNELSEGCHALIQEGAKLVANQADILQEWGIEEETVEQKGNEALERHGAFEHMDDPIKRSLMKACVQPRSVDDLALQLNYSIADIQAHLFDLQVAGRIEQDFTGLWRVV